MIKVLLILALVFALLATPLFWMLFTCGVKEKDYGLNTKWTLFNGCVIEVKPGIYAPVDKYRGVAE
jgi:hypothetical protein